VSLRPRAERDAEEAELSRRDRVRHWSYGAAVAWLLAFGGWYGWQAWNRRFPMQRAQDRLDAVEARLDALERGR
jgi:predicted negative regulator of RcsB-dependent stress response